MQLNSVQNHSFVVKNFEHAYGSQLKVSGSFEVQTDTKFANTLIQNKGIVKQSAGTTTNIERPFIVENGGTFSTAAGKLGLQFLKMQNQILSG